MTTDAKVKPRAIDPADYHEGPAAARRFDELFGDVLTTPRREIQKRQAAYNGRKAQRKRKKRG